MNVQPSLNEAIGRSPAMIRHDLVGAVEFEPDRLVELGADLPPKWRLAYGEAGEPLDFQREDLLQRLRDHSCSFRLYHLEVLPSFMPAIRRCYDLAGAPEAAAREGGVTAKSSIVFVGSTGAITRMHLDHHHNLLLQMRGTKRLTVGWFTPPQRQFLEVERAFALMGASPSAPTETASYVMGPGDGIYLPAYTFHSAEVLDGDVSVALSCAFSTPVTDRAYRVHRTNTALYRLGLRPSPTGASRVGDTAKDWLGRGLQRVRPVRS